MKKLASLILGLTVICLSLSALPQPVSGFSFDTAVQNADLFGKEQLILSGAAKIGAPGISGNGLQLIRNDKTYVKIGKGFAFPGDFSISLWMRTPKNYVEQMTFILSRHDAGYVNGYFLQVNYQGGIGADNKASFYYQGYFIVSKSDVNDGAWHHIVVTFNTANGATLYVDGKNEAHGPPAVIQHVPATSFLLGGLAWFGGEPKGSYQGDIDELYLFNTELQPQDIAVLYSIPSPFVKKSDTVITSSQSGQVLQIKLKDGRTISIPISEIESMSFVK